MNKQDLNRRGFIARVVGTGLSASLSQLSAFGKAEPAPSEEGFTPLFDGKTLDGWHTNQQKISHGTGGHWAVEDGAIVGEQDPPGNGGMLMTDKEFGDFDLMLELNPVWINNVKMADFDGASCPQPDYKKEEIYRQLGPKGPIAFQIHGGKQMWKSGAKCRWRNIRVKML